jgi:acetaldehyde dehydrogenase
MQTTIYALLKNGKEPNLQKLNKALDEMVLKIRQYVPQYSLVFPAQFNLERIVVSLRVKGLGDYLPEYAGNLDIINCAAVAMAEEYAKKGL